MTALLDTSFVVRYLVGTPPELAARAKSAIESGEPLMLSEVALAETAYVLESFYELERVVVVDALIAFVLRRNIRMLDLPKGLTLEALRLCRDSRRHSYADALLWAQARHHRVDRVLTFDRRFPSVGVSLEDS